ncbi:MAG: c-type cytochrome biogenesis protein CcmI [Roseitalea porphyridii]
MTIWIVLGAITLLVAGFILWPVVQQRQKAASSSNDVPDSEIERDLAVYRDQLSEIDRDIDRGVLNAEQATAARIEVQRRILAADQRIKDQTEAPNRTLSPAAPSFIAVGSIAFFLLAGFGLYLDIGNPDMPDRPIASRVDEINAIRQAESIDEDRAIVLNRAVSDLSQKLIEDPSNLQGWELLGASLMALGRPVEAQTAFLEAVKLSGRDGDYLAMYAESLIRSNNGQINPIALGVLNEAATTDSADPRIQYYIGLADAQDGNVPAAVDRWIALANGAPADAGWLPMVVARIKDAALVQGIDIENRLNVAEAPAPMAGPSEDDVRSAQQMTPEERQEMILSMVSGLAERLETEPDNPDGWARLMQAYMVLGKPAEARTAYQKAGDVFAGQPDLVNRFDALAKEIGIVTN